MNLYIDIDRAMLVAGPSSNAPVTQLSFKRGDSAVLQVTFQQLGAGGYIPVVLPAGTTFKFGLKVPGQYDGSFIVYSSAWAAPAGSATAYTLQPSFNTVPLNALLDPGGDTANDLPQVGLMGEITWTDPSGNETSTRTFSVTVFNDVIKDGEGAPASGSPSFPAADQLVQALGPTALTGNAAGTLDNLATASRAAGLRGWMRHAGSGADLLYLLRAGTDAANVPWIVPPADYDAATNAKVWELVQIVKSGAPCLWDGNLSKFFQLVASDDGAGHVTQALDQTGFQIAA